MKAKSWLIGMVVMLIGACSYSEPTEKHYQFGDITRFTKAEIEQIHLARVNYCAAHSSDTLRKVSLTIIHSFYAFVPKDGVCVMLPEHELHIETINQENIRDGP